MLGPCTACRREFHQKPDRLVSHLTDPLHIAVAQTCALKVLIKYCEGGMTVVRTEEKVWFVIIFTHRLFIFCFFLTFRMGMY